MIPCLRMTSTLKIDIDSSVFREASLEDIKVDKLVIKKDCRLPKKSSDGPFVSCNANGLVGPVLVTP